MCIINFELHLFYYYISNYEIYLSQLLVSIILNCNQFQNLKYYVFK